jgi:hypothetical protein
MTTRVTALSVLLLISGLSFAHADQVAKPACKIMRIAGAAFLQQCDDRLSSFALTMPGTERTPAREHTNKFRFSCRPGFCQDEPEIWGWFINPETWKQSQQDESGIFAVFADLAGWKLLGSEQHFRNIFRPSCELSQVTVAGLPGQMVCYDMKSEVTHGLSTVVIVAADAEVGFVIAIQGSELKNVRDQAASALRAFSLERGRGDATLERWLQ